MGPDEITALLSTGAATLVAAAATDAWGLARGGFVRLFGRGDPEREAATARRLDALATVVEEEPVTTRAEVCRQQQAGWLARLSDLAEDDPTVVEDLRTLVEHLRPQLPQEQQLWVQNVNAHGGGRAFGVQHGSIIYHEAPPATDV